MEFHGIPWNSTAFYGITRRSMEFHGILWNSTAFYGIPRHYMECHGILWNSTAFYGIPSHIKAPLFFFHFSIDCMESDGKLVPILHGIPSNDFHRIPYDSTADLQTGLKYGKHCGMIIKRFSLIVTLYYFANDCFLILEAKVKFCEMDCNA
ncbi:hypothetical protein DPMN_019140 [Dreissena polymorpha]|uniref:Uncharacterized protein n=1 Tax=Dreissena polymorpha TaxID=45954 RepID=A0A9D4NGG8_DREPO|nr:hypothetical protein DPMN_019140 [Dreissena polymorpha]